MLEAVEGKMDRRQEIPKEAVRKALNSINKRKTQGLSRIPALVDLPVVQDSLALGTTTDLEIGRAVRKVITAAIKHYFQSSDDFPSDLYTLLRLHVLDGKTRVETWQEMGISETEFHRMKRTAEKALANLLPTFSLKSLGNEQPKLATQLPRPPFREFVERRDNVGHNLVDVILRVLSPSDRAWIVAIAGVGGVGKTSLAYEAALRCQHQGLFQAIIWTSAKLSYLSPSGLWPTSDFIRSLDDILSRVALAFSRLSILKLGLAEKQEKIKEIFEDNRCLLVIDNTESLSEEDRMEVQAFIRGIPVSSKVLLTSRQRDYVGGEIILLEGMNDDEALQFIQMEISNYGIELNQEDADAILEFSEGIPLAIQYVLGQVRSFGSIRVRLLERESPEELLEFIFEGSYSKLGEQGQLLLHAIAIFDVPALLDEIEAASQLGVRLESELGHLFALFLVTEVVTENGKRYGLLEPTRRFLGGLARQDGRLLVYRQRAHERLAHYYASFRTYSYVERMALLRDREVNILQTMEWCYGQEKRELFLDLYDLVGLALSMWSRWNDRAKWGEVAVEVASQLEDWESVAWHMAHDLGWMYLQMGQRDKARTTWNQAREIARTSNCQVAYGLAQRNLAVMECSSGNYDRAEAMLLEAIDIFESLGEKRLLGSGLSALGELYTRVGKLSDARNCIERGLDYKRQIEEIPGITGCLVSLAAVHIELGEYEVAANLMDEGIRLSREHHILEEYANCLIQRLRLELITDRNTARETLDEAKQICERLGATVFLQEIRQISLALKEVQY